MKTENAEPDPDEMRHRSESRGAELGHREKERLAIVEGIKSRADSFSELGAVCRGGGRRIWQAQAAALVYRGCGCATYCFPPGTGCTNSIPTVGPPRLLYIARAIRTGNHFPGKIRY